MRKALDGYCLIDVNPRFGGGTSSRLHLGFDEVAWIVNAWLGWEVLAPCEGGAADWVARTFAQYLVWRPST